MNTSGSTKAVDLKPCPFCGAGETISEPDSKVWAGMEWRILSWRIRHWCSDKTHGSLLTVKGKDQQEAEERWNRRLAPEPAGTASFNVTRYKVVQDKGEYCLKGCPDGDLVDFSAYAALLNGCTTPTKESKHE